MRILVTKTTRAAPDGVTVRSYRAGETAEMPEELARVFLREGWGREADAKDLEATPANKALDGARRNKRRRRRRKKRGEQDRADRPRGREA